MLTAPLQMFHLFPTLPPELRIKIWHHALERRRIIKVRLRHRFLMDAVLSQQVVCRPEKREEERYGVVVDGYQTLSKLFRVSRESRDAASRFYRVHLPCWLIKSATRNLTMKPGILYFNPEHDFLYISNDACPVVNFLHDLKTIHDPRNIGLLNLAIDSNGLTGRGSLSSINPTELDPPLKTSFTETLSQLHEVFFVQIQRAGRHVFGSRSGAPTSENQQNPSFPITAMALNFDRPLPDPRPIGQDLGKVFVKDDPGRMLHAWQSLLHTYLEGPEMPQTEHRVLLSFAPTSYDVYDHRDAEEWLRKEEETWVKETSRDDQSEKVPEKDSEVSVRTAFGFWLFPVHPFGALPENPNDGIRDEGPRIMDLKEHWPELAFLDLP
ncbi:hypothetical protein F4677DRAFT_77183 [Hypoxylon crocopeplum]|nr:hypothetical protein F4677DRAFT_77183 [Hypoxylon crocopeplum]